MNGVFHGISNLAAKLKTGLVVQELTFHSAEEMLSARTKEGVNISEVVLLLIESNEKKLKETDLSLIDYVLLLDRVIIN